ncbi:MAG TPA: anhydro-N-acetylmuramic acid kinase [Oculatellaceae cyanobacterium]|jgi:anhydro-N-acetylmuramic acid kinase
MTRVIGLISGTSVDGIDAALVEISGEEADLKVELLTGSTYPYPLALRQQILDVCAGKAISMAELAELDDAIAYEFAQAAQAVQVNHKNPQLIGSHGQTVYHRPLKQQSPANSPAINMAYSLQLGRGALIADLTRIPTVSNFRVADIAAGGEGAPLVPKIDACLLGHPTKARCIQNIGGIGNVAYLPATNDTENVNISGWDTGPGNTLLDIAVQQLSDGSQTYDKDGKWAATGTPCDALVQQWLTQEYFQITPPKSTGREHFGREYLQQCLTDAHSYNLSPADLLATLAEFTVASIVHSYRNFLPQMPDEVLLCGGGSRNLYLKERLQAQINPIPVLTTDEAGVSADFKEAIAFAVLAYWHQLGITGNLIQATGARQPAILGELYLPIG